MLGVTEALYGKWGAVLLLAVVFCLFGLCAFIADWRTKLELRQELAVARARLRGLVWASADEGGQGTASNAVPAAWDACIRLRNDLAEL